MKTSQFALAVLLSVFVMVAIGGAVMLFTRVGSTEPPPIGDTTPTITPSGFGTINGLPIVTENDLTSPDFPGCMPPEIMQEINDSLAD